MLKINETLMTFNLTGNHLSDDSIEVLQQIVDYNNTLLYIGHLTIH